MQLKGLNEVVEFVKSNDNFLVVHHHDADGMTAGAIACKMLKRLGKEFKFEGIKQLDSIRLQKIKNDADTFLFVDLGSGQLEMLQNELKGKKFAVVDHHKPQSETKIPHFNAHLSGFDGSNDISGSGSIYLVAKEINEKNKDLAPVAIVGAIGDMQDSKGRLEGLNRDILKDAEESGLMKEKIDIKLFGRHSRHLTQFLSYCTYPFFPGLTAKEDECAAFLRNLKIDLQENGKWKTYIDLTADEKKRLISGLYVYGKDHNISEKILKSLVGEVYELLNEPEKTELKDAREFATLLNACGRHGRTELGVKVSMGDRGLFYAEAKELLQKHRKALRNGIEWAQEKGAREMKNLSVIEGEGHIKDTLIGIIAGMLYGANVIDHRKPVIGLAVDENENIKISGRGTWPLVAQGLDLGKGFKKAAEPLGGAGGGHVIAAGATIPKDKKEEFLNKFDKIIGEQLKGD